MKVIEIIEGDNVHVDAARRARYGHRNWICWVSKQGIKKAAPMTVVTLKQAMLESGTQGWIVNYQADNSTPWLLTWPLAVHFLNKLKRGTFR